MMHLPHCKNGVTVTVRAVVIVEQSIDHSHQRLCLFAGWR
jgi:hypothetical protein